MRLSGGRQINSVSDDQETYRYHTTARMKYVVTEEAPVYFLGRSAGEPHCIVRNRPLLSYV